MAAKQSEPSRFASSFSEWLISAAVAGLVCIIIFNLILCVVTVNGESMEPTYHDGQRLITLRTNTHSSFEYGDVVVIKLPETSLLGKDTIIKRVVATAGQSVSFTSGGVLLINGTPEAGSFDNSAYFGDYELPYTVPDGCIFVMGDNRNNSTDSRMLGAIPVEQVYGKKI